MVCAHYIYPKKQKKICTRSKQALPSRANTAINRWPCNNWEKESVKFPSDIHSSETVQNCDAAAGWGALIVVNQFLCYTDWPLLGLFGDGALHSFSIIPAWFIGMTHLHFLCFLQRKKESVPELRISILFTWGIYATERFTFSELSHLGHDRIFFKSWPQQTRQSSCVDDGFWMKTPTISCYTSLYVVLKSSCNFLRYFFTNFFSFLTKCYFLDASFSARMKRKNSN